MKNKFFVYLFFESLFIICLTGQLGEFEQNRKNLIENLLNNYQASINPGAPTNVSLSFAVTQINSIDQTSQNMIITGYLTQMWNDPRLEWISLLNYSNISSVTIQATQLWIPDTVVNNIADGDPIISSTINPYNYATVWSNGLILLYLPLIKLQTQCTITTKTFPYDKQKCSIRFGSWSNSKAFIDYNQTYPTIYYKDIIKNPIWELEAIEVSVYEKTYDDGAYQSIDYLFYLKRKSLYYMLNGIIPCFILNIMTIISFFLPYSDQINLSMTCFLTLTVNALLISSDIPVQSDYVPYITVYFLVSITIPLISIIWFIIFELIKAKQKLSSWLNYFCHICLKIVSKKYEFMLESDKEAIELRFEFLNFIIACLFALIVLIIQIIIWVEISK